MDPLHERVLSIIKPLQLSSLATIKEDGKPWVRYVMTRGKDDFSVRCATHVEARKVAQIEKTPDVHLTCGCTDPMKAKDYLQIVGKATVSTDQDTKQAFWYPQLSMIFDSVENPDYAVIEIIPSRIEIWNVMTKKMDVLELD